MSQDPSPLRHFGIVEESREGRLLRLLLETVVQAVGGDEGSLLVHEPEAGDLRFAMTVGDRDSEQKLLGQHVPLGQGITGLAAATFEVQTGAPTFHNVQQTEGKSSGPEAVIAAPMVSDDQLLGVVTSVSFKAGKRFNGDDARLCGKLATIAAVLIEQHRKLATAEKSVSTAAGAVDPEAAVRLDEIGRALQRIAARQPSALMQIAALVSSIEAALALAPSR
jgi:GAF domain-containing protein